MHLAALLREKSGKSIGIHGPGQAICNDNGKPIRFADSSSDVTACKQSEQALYASNERNRALLKANRDLITRVSRTGVHLDIHVPDQVKEWTHISPEEFIGQNVSAIFPSDFAREHERYRTRALDTGEMQIWEYESPIESNDRYLEARFVPSSDDEVLISIRDITERVELERQVIAIAEHERTRIGRDLHDGLGQLLTGVSLGLKYMSCRLADEHSLHRQQAEQLNALVHKAIVEVRQVSHLLSAGTSNELGLAAALEVLAEEISDYPDVDCSLHCCSEHDTHDAEIETQLYRIAQQSISNAIIHGQANHIELHYECDGQTTRLEVLDDGVGIPPSQDRVEGTGLESMRYRAAIINGQVEISLRPKAGTRVHCYCPCKPRWTDSSTVPGACELNGPR